MKLYERDHSWIRSSEFSEPFVTRHSANMSRWPNVGLLLCQRRRRWAKGKPTLGQRLICSVTRAKALSARGENAYRNNICFSKSHLVKIETHAWTYLHSILSVSSTVSNK